MEHTKYQFCQILSIVSFVHDARRVVGADLADLRLVYRIVQAYLEALFARHRQLLLHDPFDSFFV